MSLYEDEANTSTENQSEALALELTCPICLQLYSEPVALPCGHIYCLACLKTMEEGLDQHSCPECQAEYKGTTSLVKSFKMCSIVETYKVTAGKIMSTADPSDVGHVTLKSTHSSVTSEPDTHHHHDLATVGENKEDGAECKSKAGFKIGSGSTERPVNLKEEKGSSQGKMERDEPKFELASQVTELNLKLEMAEDVLKKEEAWKSELTTANSQLKEKASKLLEQIKDLAQSYSEQVTQMIEEELGPGEASVESRVSQAFELTKQLRHTVLRAESLLTEKDEATFNNELQSLQPCIEELLAGPVREDEDHVEVKVSPSRACPKLEHMNAELKERLGEAQRSLRTTLNPSEVTFDPETAHPNLLLSEDLKTVTFSAVKQPYLSSPQRFTSFFQVLSTQSFSEGEHCWEVELEGSPWIIGVCYSGKMERSGLPSALESSRSSWCLMWFNNLLTAFEQSHSVPLKRTTVSRRLEIKLSFKTHRLSFYNISPTSGKTHIYTFKANLSEPVHLAYRMMSGHPKARVTICS
ncbi:E3 ubiquitin-protein ligase TRIM39 [Melanotaenia boesemani]|uniref:E3 ubiquitin-protein ligase TRIM39 n=1 Tax=Melanotaenia boesemani TaxID=1250792 RepID=UPI001C053872|nr:E3 ubiquitin-protein ligase TRIM39 [Melanotaenia boesemani]